MKLYSRDGWIMRKRLFHDQILAHVTMTSGAWALEHSQLGVVQLRILQNPKKPLSKRVMKGIRDFVRENFSQTFIEVQ